jgi:hypothetical protein
MTLGSFLSIERWLLEFCSPRKKFSKVIIRALHTVRCNFNTSGRGTIPMLVWDIRSSSITFDFLLEMVQVYIQNEEDLQNGLDVVLYIPEGKQLRVFKRNADECFVDETELNARIYKLILPIAHGFNFVRSASVVTNVGELEKKMRNAGIIYPNYYNPDYYYPQVEDYVALFDRLKSNVCLKVPRIVLKSAHNTEVEVNAGKPSTPYATFTIRDYGWSIERNTSYSDLHEFLEYTRTLGVQPTIIPDDLSKIPLYDIPLDVVVMPAARLNIYTRYEVYKDSVFNVFPNCGPALLSLLIEDTKTIIYNYGVPSNDGSLEYLSRNLGLSVLDQPFACLSGYVIWWQLFPNLTQESLSYAVSRLASPVK